jgi:hypothetical protein
MSEELLWVTSDGFPYISATVIKSNLINTAQMFERKRILQ